MRWLNLLAEYQYRVLHISGRTNPADFLTRKRFPDGRTLRRTRATPSRIRHSSYSPRPARFPRAGPSAESPCFLHAEFAAERAALPSDPVLGPLAAAAQAQVSSPGRPPTPRPRWRFPRGASSPGGTGYSTVSARAATAFACPARFRHRCCTKLHATPLGAHSAGRLVTLAVTRRWPWRAPWGGGPACRRLWRNMCALARRVSASRQTTCRRPAY